MNKRAFLKKSVLAGLASTLPLADNLSFAATKKNKIKNWVWLNPDKKDSEDAINKRYESYAEAGISGVFLEADVKKHFVIAKKHGLEAHRWIWTLNRGEKELLETHPEWYAVSRDGKSCAENPPYVNYYRWLCPSRTEVQDYIVDHAKAELDKDYVDGIHLDYVRYCDVILPVNLWSNYGIEQTKELPEYDFCYCDNCRSKFKEWKGIDPLDIEFPDQSLSWRKFRYDNISTIVNKVAEVAHKRKKKLTAAVFPTPEVARRIVRQDWTKWNMDGICPMIYHGFYKEDVAWIGDAVAEGIDWLCGKFPLYAGLFLPDFKTKEELQKGIEYALKNGAGGVSFFGHVDNNVLDVLKKVEV